MGEKGASEPHVEVLDIDVVVWGSLALSPQQQGVLGGQRYDVGRMSE